MKDQQIPGAEMPAACTDERPCTACYTGVGPCQNPSLLRLVELADLQLGDGHVEHARETLHRAMDAASTQDRAPASQPAAAPRYEVLAGGEWFAATEVQYNAWSGGKRIATPAPAPADERAAFEECIREHSDPDRFDDRIARQDGHYVEYATALAWAAWQGRAASANETGAEGVAIGEHDLSTSAGGRGYIAEFFAKRLLRHDFQRYIEERLAADFACALAQYLSERDAAPAQAAEAVAIPAGWKLVPVEPTEEMTRSGWGSDACTGQSNANRVYRAMLEAAPLPPAPAATRASDHIADAAEMVGEREELLTMVVNYAGALVAERQDEADAVFERISAAILQGAN